jgi:hypothetical protein
VPGLPAPVNPGPVVVPGSAPVVPAPNPTPPDPCLTVDPCTKKISGKLQDSIDLIEKLKKLLEDLTKTTTIEVDQFDKCVNGEPKYASQSLSVPTDQAVYLTEIFTRLANIEGLGCTTPPAADPVECVATVPEWWQVRFEGGIEQLILSYRELRSDGTIGKDWYPITIPHPKSTVSTTARLTTNYRKGNWQILLILNDNSKVILNAFDELTGLAFMRTQLIPLIDPAYLTKSKLKTAHFPDSGFTELVVTHKNTDYFATGQRKLKATWRARVNYP